MDLTQRQRVFIDHYLVDMNASRAVREAGYSLKGHSVQGNRLLRNVKVKAEIEKRQAETAAHLEITKQHVLRGILQAIELAKAKQDPRSQIAGWKEIAKLLGFYAPETIQATITRQGEEMLKELRTLPEKTLLKLASGSDVN